MKIALGCDHGGVALMNEIRRHLTAAGHELCDHGTHEEKSVDYPDFAHKVAVSVVGSEADLGVLVCGTGIGISMAANKNPGVRAALCTDTYMARMARQHNDANVLCMGGRVVGPGLALEILDAFLGHEFEGGRHARRVGKLETNT